MVVVVVVVGMLEVLAVVVVVVVVVVLLVCCDIFDASIVYSLLKDGVTMMMRTMRTFL